MKLNTTYSFGIDDQEFVVAFEINFPEDFLDLVQQLRETGDQHVYAAGHADLQLRAGSGGGDAGSAWVEAMATTTVVLDRCERLSLKLGRALEAIAASEPVAVEAEFAKTVPERRRKPLDPARIAAILDALRKTYPGVVVR